MALLDRYAQDFRGLNDNAPTWLARRRQRAFDQFAADGFPTTALEDWKYTNLAPLTQIPFQRCDRPESAPSRGLIDRARLGSDIELVFVHGRLAPELSRGVGVTELAEVSDLATALSRWPDAVEQTLDEFEAVTTSATMALNSAFLSDGAWIRVRPGARLASPIHLLFLSPASSTAVVSHPRVIVVAERDSQATIIETHTGEASYFTNAVTDIRLEANAQVRHDRVQLDSARAFHLATIVARQQRDSRLQSSAVSLGAALARTEVRTVLDGEGSECELDGLYLGSGEQHVDHHTEIDHRTPRTTSQELYKGILDDRASGVFNGKVFVRPNAIKSDARQLNKNLLLSDTAEVDTKPQLEIFADDVKCSHGATIGRLDEDALFYLRSRGLDPATARSVLIYAFANEMIRRIPTLSLQRRLGALLEGRLSIPGGSAEVGA